MFFLRDGVNDPLSLKDSSGNLARFLRNEEKIQQEIGGHVVTRCKEDEFEGVGTTNFGFVEDNSNVSWP